jgi:hypothetical protein
MQARHGQTDTHVRTHVHVYTCVHTHVQMCSYAHTNVFVCTYKCVRMYIHTYVFIRTYICVHSHIHMCSYACTYVFVCTYIHTYVFVCMYICVCTHMQMWGNVSKILILAPWYSEVTRDSFERETRMLRIYFLQSGWPDGSIFRQLKYFFFRECIGKYRRSPHFVSVYLRKKFCNDLDEKMGWTTFWPIKKPHLVTLSAVTFFKFWITESCYVRFPRTLLSRWNLDKKTFEKIH